MLAHVVQLLQSRQFSIKSMGTRMLPLLQPSDTVTIRRIRFEKIDVNDLLMVKKKTNIFVHRVIYKNQSYCITKGDSNYLSDGRISPRQIVGKVYQVKREGQVFTPVLSKPSVYFLTLVLYSCTHYILFE